MAVAFADGWIIDIILGLMALEAVALIALRRSLGRGPSPLEILASLAAGLCLLIALRTALTGGPWQLIAAALAASLVVHLTDMRLRWSRSSAPSPERST
ncbi:MAG: hypothetical protein MUE79_03745 [Nitratireductor sp.]|jgi:hypothetical protein|nr:hypothetical protein [Nitratireductor sp.]